MEMTQRKLETLAQYEARTGKKSVEENGCRCIKGWQPGELWVDLYSLEDYGIAGISGNQNGYTVWLFKRETEAGDRWDGLS